MMVLQLKKEYKEVKQIWELSGFRWDVDKHLATAADDVWDKYIEVCCIKLFGPILTHCHLQAHPKQKKWRKTSFPLFNDMADLIEGTYATGKGVFHPGEPPSNSSDEGDVIDSALSQPPLSSISPLSTAAASPLPIIATPAATTALPAPATAAPAAMPPADATSSGK